MGKSPVNQFPRTDRICRLHQHVIYQTLAMNAGKELPCLMADLERRTPPTSSASHLLFSSHYHEISTFPPVRPNKRGLVEMKLWREAKDKPQVLLHSDFSESSSCLRFSLLKTRSCFCWTWRSTFHSDQFDPASPNTLHLRPSSSFLYFTLKQYSQVKCLFNLITSFKSS